MSACRSANARRDRRGRAAARRAGVAVDDLAVGSPTLDDVFLPLTGPRRRAERRASSDDDGVASTRSPTRSSSRERSLLRIPRQPDLLVGFTVQPIMFVLLFVYVFGGAISTPGLDYVDFLIPGIIVQSMTFGGFVTALGLAEDLKKGLIDRFRSLPMSRAAVLTGRTLADVATNVAPARRDARRSASPSASASRRASPRSSRGIALAAADRLRVLVGVRVHRPDRVVAGGGERLRVHDPLPGHVRLVGVRARGDDAELAAADRRAQPVHEHGQRRPGAVRRHPGRERRSGWRSPGRSAITPSSACSRCGATATPSAASEPDDQPAGNCLRSSQRSTRR